MSQERKTILELNTVPTLSTSAYVEIVQDTLSYKATVEGILGLLSASNVGSGAQVFQDYSNENFNFRSIVGTGVITVTENTDDITISSSAEVNSATNLELNTATMKGVFAGKSGPTLTFKSIEVGGGMTIEATTTKIKLSATVTDLDSISDVTITNPVSGEVLVYNGSIWVNVAMSGDATIDSTGIVNVNIASTDLTDSNIIARSSDTLDFFSPTTSAQLAAVISNETGSGNLVFGTSPTIITPFIGDFSNSTHDHSDNANGGQISNSALIAGAYPSITGVGTLATGTWNADVITVPYGGTGAQTFTANAVLLGDGVSAIKAVASLGNSSQVLTSNGPSAPPTFQDVAQPPLNNGNIYIGNSANVPFGYFAEMYPKSDCKVATTGNITLEDVQVIDGESVQNPDRVLVKDQSVASENGIYVVTDVGDWARATDADTNAEVQNGLITNIIDGVSNGGTTWYISTPNPITLDTTSITFEQFSLADIAHLNSTAIQIFQNDVKVNGTLFTKNTQASEIAQDETEIYSLADLPSPISGVITLPSGLYTFKQSIDFGTNRIVAAADSSIVLRGAFTFGALLEFTASSNTFITSASNDGIRVESMDILMKGNNGQIFDITSGETLIRDVELAFDDAATGTRKIGIFGGSSPVDIVELEDCFGFGYIDGLELDTGSCLIVGSTFVPETGATGTTFIVNSIQNAAFFTTLGYSGETTENIFDISTGIDSPINISDVFDFALTGSPAAFYKSGGADQTNKWVTATNNGLSPNSMTIAETRLDEIPLTVNVTAQNTPTPVQRASPTAGDFIEDPATEGFSIDTATGIMTYTGIKTITITLQYSVSATKSGTASNVTFSLAQNDVIIDKTKSTILGVAGTETSTTYIGGILKIQPDDTIQLYLENTSNDNNIQIQSNTTIIQKA